MSSQIPQKPSVAKKNSILSWLKNQVSFTDYQAIDLILSPCCIEGGTVGNIAVDCVSTNIYNITITFNNLPGVISTGVCAVSIGNEPLNVSPETVSIINNVAVFNNVDISGIGGANTYRVLPIIQQITPIGSAENAYITIDLNQSDNGQNIVFPAC